MDADLKKTLVPYFLKNSPIFVKKGQIVIRPEDNLNNIYFIEKGYVKFYHLSEEGKETIFMIYKPGYLFPVLYAFLGSENRYYFEAMTPLILRKTTRSEFAELIDKKPQLNNIIRGEVLTRFEELLEKYELVAHGNAYKIVSFILKTCAVQFGELSRNFIVIQIKLRHQDIASMAGLTRETVSIEMKKLETKGLIRYRRGRIQVKDLKYFKKATKLEF